MECAHERVAQSVEHVTFNHGVLGSSPSALTIKIDNLYDLSGFPWDTLGIHISDQLGPARLFQSN